MTASRGAPSETANPERSGDAKPPVSQETAGLPKIDAVNSMVNRYPYIPSAANWSEPNHWETPFEFLARSGQCQDYAIAKFMLLRAAGVPNELLRVVVLRDRRLGLDHAVTVAYID